VVTVAVIRPPGLISIPGVPTAAGGAAPVGAASGAVPSPSIVETALGTSPGRLVLVICVGVGLVAAGAPVSHAEVARAVIDRVKSARTRGLRVLEFNSVMLLS
jgi:hypothetical protein